MDTLTDEIESILYIAREVMGMSDLLSSAPGTQGTQIRAFAWHGFRRALSRSTTNLVVYQVPPRTAASGYKAADWDVEQFMWKGRMRVIEIGERCEIRLEVSSVATLDPS
jgi:hypothetical protein